MLDFMYAGKKLRKWYGETDMVLPRDGGTVEEDMGEGQEAPMEDIARSSVVVLYPEDDRFPMSEQVLLELIVRRADVLVVTNDLSRAKEGYGQYVNAVKLDSSDTHMVQTANWMFEDLPHRMCIWNEFPPLHLQARVADGVPATARCGRDTGSLFRLPLP